MQASRTSGKGLYRTPYIYICVVFYRVQLNLYVCCPFGEYEIDLDVESYSDEGSTLQQRTAWEIENGPDEVRGGGCDITPPIRDQRT